MPTDKKTLVWTPPRWLLRGASIIHRGLYRVSSGKIGARVGEVPVLLLTTIGRRSGRRRTTPLGYLEHPSGWAVPAFNGGYDYDPQWWKNLKADAGGVIRIGGSLHPVRGRIATPEEQKEYSARLVAMDPDYQKHQEQITREISMVVLERA